jgi:hypothetical protein
MLYTTHCGRWRPRADAEESAMRARRVAHASLDELRESRPFGPCSGEAFFLETPMYTRFLIPIWH